MCRVAKHGTVICTTNTRTERRYNATIDGPADSCLTLPLSSNRHKGQLLAVLSLRRGANAQGAPKGRSERTRGRGSQQQGFSRRDETFGRVISAAVGPALHLLVVRNAENRKQEAAVMQEESLQKVW
jgi:hypothetical protein